MNGKQLRLALHSGQQVFGTLVSALNAKWLGAFSSLALDFVFIDTENMPLGRESTAWLCQCFAAMDICPVVRIPSPDPYQAALVLDGGAQGVVAPYVETVEQVEELVGAVKFGPLKGQRLKDILTGRDEPNAALKDYLKKHNENNVLIINVESRPAVDNLEQLLAVPGLDGVLIGPHDLSVSLGIPQQYSDPSYLQAVKDVLQKARARGIGAGIHNTHTPEQAVYWVQHGAGLLIHSADIIAARGRLGDEFAYIRSHVTSSSEPASGTERMEI